MNSPLEQLPPKWPLAFLRWFLKPEYLEEIEGDLEEIFQDFLAERSYKSARLSYTWEVVRLLRPNLIRHFQFNHRLNIIDMTKHNFLIIIRNFLRYKSTFLINLVGLTMGLTCAFIALLWIQDELEIDQFHANDTQLFQVMQTAHFDKGKETMTSTPAPLSDALVEEHPEVKAAVKIIPPGWIYQSSILRNGDASVRIEEQYVSEDYFNVFSFPLIAGDKDDILKTKSEVLISASIAQKLFGTTEDLLGKELLWEHKDNSGNYVISGIFEDPPKNSTLQFEVIFHFDLFLESFDYLKEWSNSDPNTFVVLAEGVDLAAYQQKIAAFVSTKVESYPHTLMLQKFSDRYLYGKYEDGQVVGGRISYIRLFSIIALFILLIACVNFMNLSTAQAARRMKEIGIKKAIGAGRSVLIGQYLGEALLISTFALVVAMGLTIFLLPGLSNVLNKDLAFRTDLWFIWAILGITFLTGLIAGIYPAFYLSRFQAVNILKGILGNKVGKGQARRALVVFQFSISVLLIISALVVYQQTELIQSKNLGYDRENILYFNNDGPIRESQSAFLDALRALPQVASVGSFSHDLTGNHGGTSGVFWKGKDPEERIQFSNIEIGYNFIETLNMELLAGRSYSSKDNEGQIIFNESAIKAMGLEDPIGQPISLWGKKREIIGVVKDFHFESLYHAIGPCFLTVWEGNSKTMVKLAAGNIDQGIDQVQKVYNEFSQGLPFEYQFLDDDYQAMYQAEKQMGSLSKYFCLIAILISCLGLFGLMTFSAERRRKEMGIRKILGAGPLRLIYLLSTDATRMVLISILIALPLGYWITSRWLDNFAFRINPQWWLFVGAGFAALLIAWLTVGIQSLRTVSVNPAETLRQN